MRPVILIKTYIKVGRLEPHWMGKYLRVGSTSDDATPEKNPFCFNVMWTVELDEDNQWKMIPSLVPEDWIDMSMTFVLHPPPSCKVGLSPMNWGNATFKRHLYPENDLMDYIMEEVVGSRSKS